MRRWVLRGAGLVVGLVALALGYMRYEGIPLHAARNSPPPGIDAVALAVGATAPPIELAAADGARWRSTEAAAGSPLVLVFYRGHW